MMPPPLPASAASVIHCEPKGFCSSNFVMRCPGHHAEVEFNWLGESGRLVIDGVSHQVVKHGIWSGQWTLMGPKGILFSAQKETAFSRSFRVETPAGPAELRAKSVFSRVMQFRGPESQFELAPNHFLTRRSTISGAINDFHLACFAFWLTSLLWRRQNNSSGGAT